MTANTTASIDLAQLDKLEALARAATPGPWMRLFGERTVYDRMEDGCRGNAIVRADVGYSNRDADNLDFIAAANPATVQQLIAIARRSLTSGTPAEPVARIDIVDGLPNRDTMFIDGATLGNGIHDLYAAPVHDAAAPSVPEGLPEGWCPECIGQGISTSPMPPGADDTCSACGGTGAAAKTEQAPVDVMDALRRCGANSDYHGKILFSVAEFDHFVTMIRYDPAAAVGAGSDQADDIRGPLTDAQREECRTLYNNLKHLQCGGIYVADDVIRRAAVFGYMNGRKDFGTPDSAAGAGSAQPAALDEAEVRKILIRHLGWLGAAGWDDDIKAIYSDIAALARAPLPAHPVQDGEKDAHKDQALECSGCDPAEGFCAYCRAQERKSAQRRSEGGQS
jgi:hypothetical protein